MIIEAGFAKSTGGKRPILLRLSDKQLYAVGLTLDVDLDRRAPALHDLLDRQGIDKASSWESVSLRPADAINDVVNTLDLALHPVTVRLRRLRADAAALGAASVVLHRQLTPHQEGVPA